MSKTSSGFRGWFAVANSTGNLQTGLGTTDFIVTVRDPADVTASISPVTESGKPGLYKFDVPSPFFLSNGVGDYGVVVEIVTVALNDVMSQVLTVSQNDFDTLASASFSLSLNDIKTVVSATWDATMFSHNAPNTAGALLSSASTGGSVQSIRDAVWNANLSSSYNVSGSAGFMLQQLSGSNELVYEFLSGRWKIDQVANQMIIFKPDNVTEIARYNLLDKNGNPTSSAPFDRPKAT